MYFVLCSRCFVYFTLCFGFFLHIISWKLFFLWPGKLLSFCTHNIYIYFFLFGPRVKEGPLSVPRFLLYVPVQYLAGCRESNPSCCDHSQVCYRLPMSYTHPYELHTSLWATHIPMSYTHPFFCTMSGFESATVCATIKLLPYLNVSVRGSRSSFRFYVGSESVQNENRSDTLLNAVLWIRIRIRSVFKGFLEPDPYSEYGSGSTHANIG